jgi:two-component system, chemotaxis family, protein-glutamate methylesterase/glutaminase
MMAPGQAAGVARVLIVDDSATIRGLLRATIATDRRLEVVGEARDPYEARDLIRALDPDVITLDVEMPRMNGLDFLERLMRHRPTPVVVVSTRTRERSVEAVRALALGAVDCVDVSRLQVEVEVRRNLLATLVAAGTASVRGTGAGRAGQGGHPSAGPAFDWNGMTVFIGSSTGGVDAIERVIAHFPADCPPTLIAQHMPAPFLDSFARRLDSLFAPTVTIAQDGDTPRPGHILLAGGGTQHLTVCRHAPHRIILVPAEEGDLYVPTVDRLFRSAVALGNRAVGVILTGMGRDGADGLLAMREAGARTIGQSGATCVIDGMPRAAREAGAVERDVPLELIGAEILRLCSTTENVAP